MSKPKEYSPKENGQLAPREVNKLPVNGEDHPIDAMVRQSEGARISRYPGYIALGQGGYMKRNRRDDH